MRTKIAIAVCVLPVAALAACSSGSGKKDVVTVTVPPRKPPAASSSGSSSGSASGTGSPRPTATTVSKLPGTCDSLLPDYAVTQALGGAPLGGKDAFVVGTPDRSISRLANLNCRYGVTGTGAAAKAKVEIGISLYSTAAKAAARVGATGDDYANHGARASAVTLDGQRGSLLTGGKGKGYDVPLLVVASGQRTVAVTIDPSVASGAELSKRSSTLATLALKKTGG